jgi:ribosome recycling factor
MQDIIRTTKQSYAEAVEYFSDRLKTVRTGRANPQLVENITVPYYGQPTPLKHMASISVPEPTVLAISPFDANAIDDIILALNNAKDLGLTPNSDGRTVRLVLPALSTERRDQLKKTIGSMAEEARISLRNVRDEAWKSIQAKQRDGELTEDDRERGRKELDTMIDEANKQVAELSASKEKEISEL